jgi:rhomboid protease GluP
MSDQTSEAPPPGAPPRPPVDAPPDPKAAEAQALYAFHESLRTVTPRIGIVKAIVAINVGIYLFMVVRGVAWMQPTGTELVAWGANHGVRTLNGEPWRLVTNFFLHFGALHLFMNMFALWSAGPVVERIYGPVRMLALYLFAGVTASVASMAVHPQVVSAGASGAVFGVYGALGAFLLRHRGTVPKLALSRLGQVAGSFIVYNVIFGFTVPAIDNAAHLGGLAGGALAGAWLSRPLVGPRPRAPVRVALVLAVAALAVVGAPRALKAPPDLSAELKKFGATETRVIGQFNELNESSRAGKLTDAAVADRVERDLLPAWRAARAELLKPRPWSPPEREWLGRVDRYTAARERAWQLLIVAARSQKPADAQALKRAVDEANRLFDELKDKQDK